MERICKEWDCVSRLSSTHIYCARNYVIIVIVIVVIVIVVVVIVGYSVCEAVTSSCGRPCRLQRVLGDTVLLG